ncbi:MAG: hypothetical protein KJ907_06740 [Actinobacteria bacterium]|nr:hypothetical protein [Actinomycetota bacterium]
MAMLMGIAIPAYLKVVSQARKVASIHSLKEAQKVIDSVTSDPSYSNLALGPYQVVDAGLMNDIEPKILWQDISPGEALPEYDKLSKADFRSVYILKDGNHNELWIYGVSENKVILYSYGVDGVWMDTGSGPYEQGLPR